MTVLQGWLAIGVPGLVLAIGLFVGRSKLRALIGYGVLAAVTAFFVFLPGGGASAAVVGLVAAVMVATGRGTHTDDGRREHHEDRKRYTTARDDVAGAPSP